MHQSLGLLAAGAGLPVLRVPLGSNISKWAIAGLQTQSWAGFSGTATEFWAWGCVDLAVAFEIVWI